MRGSDTAAVAVSVTDAFDHHAASYDRLVGANPGYHRHLRISARRLGLPSGGSGLRVLDLGCGTGASTAALARVLPRAEIIGVDASAGMLAAARAKRWPARVRFVHARAEELSAADIDGPADAVLAAYLLRNCPEPDTALAAMRALLRPGGRIVLHEYSVADSAAARAVWSLVCWSIIIPLGRAVTGRADLYRYLWRSVLDFDGAAALRARLRAAGLDSVRTAPMPGWQHGIVHTFTGRVPDAAAAPRGGA
ncbi:ubiquinone/menaquinone biosynthesis C-methylase UbiE [Murinocardiopsis flavida]|uniref:Ubiquinone/menaquinone biosynthesis C-methylase UbiE n=1 Tax=Murinocardiopsis flavida TaxID=645275 RepID=A0A2P8DKL4_9ACTN|nr:class I SAM-dependent methyltransferase [Murinocardiopsis flavida]PSK97754.1 ubiquinone/menaquinone biosynthesis C-methylase UbiE [Murinocardiopsis flavida]